MEEVNEVEKMEEVKKVEEMKEVNEVEDVGKVEQGKKVEEVNEVGKVEEGKKVEEVEEVNEVEEVGKVEEEKKVEEVGEVEEVEKMEEVKKVKGVKEVEDVNEVAEVGSVEEGKKSEELKEVKKMEEVEEVGRIHLQSQTYAVSGMVVYNNCVYTAQIKGEMVYCYSNNGEFRCKYEHKGGDDFEGMCLMLDGDTAMLVISDFTNKALIWIVIRDDVTMEHHHTQQLDYHPNGSYNDTGDLMVCDADNHKIHRYRRDGHPLGVMTLPDDVHPCYVTRRGDSDQYVISDPWCDQVIIVDKDGELGTRYKDHIHGVKLGTPQGVVTDGQGRLLVSDLTQHQVLILGGDGDEMRQLLQPHHLMYPSSMYLDTDQHRLYVSGTDQDEECHVFVYKYTWWIRLLW